ncbi:MAG: invasion associated locus B family protein [Pseudomonadota bacterium]
MSQTFFRAASLTALVAIPVVAPAQEETLPVGRPVEEVGATYTAETHGDWEIRCIRAAEGQPEPCQLYQLLLDEGGNPVAELNIFDLPDEGQVIAGATVVTPLDTLLPPGIRMRVDEGPAAEYPFAFCQQVGCFARLGLTEGDIQAFRDGGQAFVSMVPLPAPDQVVEISASLSGFTAGFAALEVRNEATLEQIRALRTEQAEDAPSE